MFAAEGYSVATFDLICGYGTLQSPKSRRFDVIELIRLIVEGTQKYSTIQTLAQHCMNIRRPLPISLVSKIQAECQEQAAIKTVPVLVRLNLSFSARTV